MSVEISPFGTLRDGREVKRITLKNVRGTAVSVLDYGATIQRFIFRDKDIVLGYDRIEGYEEANGSYIGATIGRVCNRITDGKFTLEGQPIQLCCNEQDKSGHLHGGAVGFDKKIWKYTVLSEGLTPSVRFDYVSPDGEEHYPGTLQVSVTFTLDVENTLTLTYHAVTDKTTVVNMTNHTYFNVHGYDGGTIEDVLLQLHADAITAVDERFDPTGEFMPVEGTPLDFRQPKPIGDAIHGEHPQVALAHGVDHNFVLAKEKQPEVREAAVAVSPRSHIKLVCLTDLPGIQVYSGNFLRENHGKEGHCWGQYEGFCLETQYFPDSVNRPEFPSIVLHPGEEYTATTQFHVELQN